MRIAFEILVAYILADALAALFHLATDCGYMVAFIRRQFEQHHREPGTMTFDLEPMIAGVPLMVAGWYFASAFLIAFGLFIGLAQLPHYWSHHPAPPFVASLQYWKLILSRETHQRHHRDNFDRDFCVLSGWNNWWINWVCRKFVFKSSPPV